MISNNKSVSGARWPSQPLFAPRHIAVMVQIALSLMLLFSAGLFFRGALKAAGLNPGFVAAGDLITEFDFSLIKKETADSRRTIFGMLQRVRELPGVRATAVGTMLPYSDFTNARRVLRAGIQCQTIQKRRT